MVGVGLKEEGACNGVSKSQDGNVIPYSYTVFEL